LSSRAIVGVDEHGSLPLSRIVKIMKTSAIRLVVHLLVHDAHVVVIDVANEERSCLQHRSFASSV